MIEVFEAQYRLELTEMEADFQKLQWFRGALAAAEKDRDASERALAEIALACAVPIAGVTEILSPDQIRDLVDEALAAAEARGRQWAITLLENYGSPPGIFANAVAYLREHL